MSHVSVPHDFKYSPNEWRKDVAETFQKSREVLTAYTVADGQVVKTVETTWEFADAKAETSIQIPEPPKTFLFVDGTYRKDAAYVFQKVRIKTTRYEAYGETSYLVRAETYDVLTGITTYATSVIDGKIPLAPTVNSTLTNLIQQPITGVLEDNCGFIDGKIAISNVYLEDESDAAKAAKRAMQRATAIVRRVKHAVNPLMKVGDTVRLVSEKRGLDARHILTRKSVTLTEQGAGDQTSEMEFWTR